MTQTPILMSRPDHDVAPHSYVIHKHSQMCRCGALHEWSAVYAKTHFKARMGHKYVTNLRPVRDPSEIAYQLPIEQIQMPIEKLLVLSRVFRTSNAGPSPSAPDSHRRTDRLEARRYGHHARRFAPSHPTLGQRRD